MVQCLASVSFIWRHKCNGVTERETAHEEQLVHNMFTRHPPSQSEDPVNTDRSEQLVLRSSDTRLTLNVSTGTCDAYV